MNEITRVRGTVLSASPIGEHDKRMVLETCELGKISVFARGCRAKNSTLLAATNPFVTGVFGIIPGSSSYRLVDASVIEYFRNLALLQPGVYMGFYFLELIDYYGREGIDGTDMLNLLFVSLKALLNEQLGDEFVRRVFELRLLAINGEFAPDQKLMSERAYRVCGYLISSPTGRIFSRIVEDGILGELETIADKALKRVVDRQLKSKKIMEALYAK